MIGFAKGFAINLQIYRIRFIYIYIARLKVLKVHTTLNTFIRFFFVPSRNGDVKI